MENDRMQVLQRLEAGEIDAATALRLLKEIEPVGVEAGPLEQPEDGETITAARAGGQPPNHWARFWLFPLAAAGILLAVGGLILFFVLLTGAARGWRVCGWLPLTLGVLGVLFALWSRSAKWLHVRVQEKHGKRIAISFPVPLTLVAWILRVVGPFVPQLRETGADEMILAFRDTGRDEPLHLQVDDEDGEHVEIYVG
ncbi:MAG TPA: hypothetical protein PKO09_05395 [Anaerolineae bacterium]|nr:hypothetical protein [Anaerolineae bacterium]